jgi:hypothetical protein
MKSSVIRLLCLITIVAFTPTSKAEYKETMDPRRSDEEPPVGLRARRR